MTREDYINTLELDNAELKKENQELKNQQKEFIKYLENEIEACNLTQNLIFSKIKETKIYKEILQKYKKMIV